MAKVWSSTELDFFIGASCAHVPRKLQFTHPQMTAGCTLSPSGKAREGHSRALLYFDSKWPTRTYSPADSTLFCDNVHQHGLPQLSGGKWSLEARILGPDSSGPVCFGRLHLTVLRLLSVTASHRKSSLAHKIRCSGFLLMHLLKANGLFFDLSPALYCEASRVPGCRELPHKL